MTTTYTKEDLKYYKKQLYKQLKKYYEQYLYYLKQYTLYWLIIQLTKTHFQFILLNLDSFYTLSICSP